VTAVNQPVGYVWVIFGSLSFWVLASLVVMHPAPSMAPQSAC